NIANENISLWSEEDGFFFDVLHLPGKDPKVMKVKSVVGIIPMFAVEPIPERLFENLPDFKKRMEFFMKEKPKLAALVSSYIQPGHGKRRLFSLLRGHRMKSILNKMLDDKEFFSPYGIRSLSKDHKENPYTLKINGSELSVSYVPGESDSNMFGGNSNWRCPIWFPIYYRTRESLKNFDLYYGGEFRVECPAGSGKYVTLDLVARELSLRNISLFMRDKSGRRPTYGENEKMQTDPHF